MEALLLELCTEYGWCGALRQMQDIARVSDRDADAVVAAILRAEGRDPASHEAWLSTRVHDRLVDPQGRGARSGLPR